MGALLPGLRQGDAAWLVIFGGVTIYELVATDLLSDATDRYCRSHPWLARVVIVAVAAHLAGVMPPEIDVLNSKNRLHRAAFSRMPFARPDRAFVNALVGLGVDGVVP